MAFFSVPLLYQLSLGFATVNCLPCLTLSATLPDGYYPFYSINEETLGDILDRLSPKATFHSKQMQLKGENPLALVLTPRTKLQAGDSVRYSLAVGAGFLLLLAMSGTENAFEKGLDWGGGWRSRRNRHFKLFVCSYISIALAQIKLPLKKSPYTQSVHVYWVLVWGSFTRYCAFGGTL